MPQGSSSYLIMIVSIVLIGIMMWWQSRKAKQQQQKMKDFRSSLEPGTEVITIGGIIGKVVSVDEEYEEIVIDSEGSLLRFTFRAINRSTRVPPSSMTTKWRTPSRPTKPTTRPRYRWTRRWNPPRTQRSPTIPRRPQTPRSDGGARDHDAV